jgi:hypothetical protein
VNRFTPFAILQVKLVRFKLLLAVKESFRAAKFASDGAIAGVTAKSVAKDRSRCVQEKAVRRPARLSIFGRSKSSPFGVGTGVQRESLSKNHYAAMAYAIVVQEAAYGTLLRSRRQQLHARIAMTLEGQFREIVETRPELLAQHCAEAGLVENAVGYWLQVSRHSRGGR